MVYIQLVNHLWLCILSSSIYIVNFLKKLMSMLISVQTTLLDKSSLTTQTPGILIGEGYTGSSLRIFTFIFFSFLLGIVVVKPKKFFKNMQLKKIASHFSNLATRRPSFVQKIPIFGS